MARQCRIAFKDIVRKIDKEVNSQLPRALLPEIRHLVTLSFLLASFLHSFPQEAQNKGHTLLAIRMVQLVIWLARY